MGSEPERDTICENDWVVLQSSDGKKVLGNVTNNSSVRIGKRKRKIGALLGKHWGDTFAVTAQDFLQPVADIPEETPDEKDMGTARNNQHLQDDNANQTLRQSAILKLKEAGVHGESLVQTVVKHSSTFHSKTPFSQHKYLQRKRAKFDIRVRVFKPTALTVCETYFEKSPEKTMSLRADALGMVLGYSGVRSGARVLLYENCTGLLTAAVAERLGGNGTVINVFTGHTPPGIEIIRMLNLGETRMKTIAHTPVELLSHVHEREVEDDQPLKYGPREGQEAGGTANGNNEHVPSAKRAEAIAQRPKRGEVKRWIRRGCDCLIVATRFDVVKVFDVLLKHVAPSGCFAAYCTHLQDAADLQYALQLSKMAIRVELMEVNMVNHQILPGRSHPAMTDSATGGYIVSGIRILSPNEEEPEEQS
ncbi:tRNA (adenine(58)-N(1))-methyltransferase non-catalytic subunit trm6 [Gracilariopsis chorda]|uniref:tRNA (adenine(58)-N(1))-methyltransferase non-catalytic subunit TRM6 n=1 Tax=Gracilariopsis chorda TaxID=448386 RepID=A0A2V3IMQ6_9FLOR|nr:tRNA (adenine(58)-N(1))-methyltransferase non-catalytic subunit trm6 [Gracilariopsis chorda]|eukprot:PXF43337.1 tRNA (adenine(58)-N(1))-methyltransferase non-catalytic subunit trm6 [Gracilariopsis chorda]